MSYFTRESSLIKTSPIRSLLNGGRGLLKRRIYGGLESDPKLRERRLPSEYIPNATIQDGEPCRKCFSKPGFREETVSDDIADDPATIVPQESKHLNRGAVGTIRSESYTRNPLSV